MQPTIHLERKTGFGRGKNPALPSKCIVGCIFNSVGLIITGESPGIVVLFKHLISKSSSYILFVVSFYSVEILI
jgi:hypothetical protein